MAIKGPALVHDSTNSSGLGSLTLNNNAAAGRRGLADAVAEGHAANGDQVPYYISNATLAGAALVFERGLGTISSNGITLSRDTIRQSSDGTTKVNLPAGAQYDVVVGVGVEELVLAANNGTEFTAATFATNLGLPRLAAANTFTNSQILQLNLAQLLIKSSPLGTNFYDIFANISDSVDGGLSFRRQGTTVLRINSAGNAQMISGSLLNGSGVSYDAFSAGTTLQFRGAPPTGWTRINIAGSRLVRLADTADTPGAQGGAAAIAGLTLTGSTGSTVLTESQIPSHTHPPGVGTGFITSNSPSGNRDRTGTSTFWSESAGSTGATGGGTGHTHTLSSGGISSDGNWLPRYEIWVAASKN